MPTKNVSRMIRSVSSSAPYTRCGMSRYPGCFSMFPPNTWRVSMFAVSSPCTRSLRETPERQDELPETPVGVASHDVPKDWPAADLHHRLGTQLGLLAEPRPETAAQDDGHHHTYPYADQPPSTVKTSPVTNDAASLARKTAASPISAGGPSRPIGVRRASASKSSRPLSRRPPMNSVST